jgi:C4-dicarboxylate-specific signal transduction histidine kinase
VYNEAQEAQRQKRDYKIEFRIVLPDGTVRYLEAIGHHLFSARGELVEVIGTNVDDTERKRLQQMQSDFAHMHRVSMMGELAASLTHEITQPIASARKNARAALNFLDKKAPDLDEIREAIDCVVADADRAREILDRIRDQMKKAPPRFGLCDLNSAINEVIILARSAILHNGVSAQTLLSEGLSLIRGDRVQLQQVALNLILNAIEAMGIDRCGGTRVVGHHRARPQRRPRGSARFRPGY